MPQPPSAAHGEVRCAVSTRAHPAAPRLVGALVATSLAGAVQRPIEQVRLAVHETVANGVLHGGGTLDVVVRRGDGTWWVTVTDRCGPEVPVARASVAVSRPPAERGRGTTLMRANGDTLETEVRPTGHVVHLGFAALDARG